MDLHTGPITGVSAPVALCVTCYVLEGLHEELGLQGAGMFMCVGLCCV